VILPDFEIRHMCREHGMVLPYDEELLNPASLDVRLGDRLMLEEQEHIGLRIHSIADATAEDPFLLMPGEFVLAETQEVFNLPDDIGAQFVLKSSRARQGYSHMLAGYCDPGWHGSKLTLELQNARRFHPLPLYPGLKIGQMVFHMLAAKPTRTYAVTGRYNSQPHVQSSLG